MSAGQADLLPAQLQVKYRCSAVQLQTAAAGSYNTAVVFYDGLQFILSRLLFNWS